MSKKIKLGLFERWHLNWLAKRSAKIEFSEDVLKNQLIVKFHINREDLIRGKSWIQKFASIWNRRAE